MVCHFLATFISAKYSSLIAASSLGNPLDNGLPLKQAWLPYRAKGISSGCSLLVELDRHVWHFGGIQSDAGGGFDGPIEVLDRVFDVPGRWSGRQDHIGEKLTKDMRHYFSLHGLADLPAGFMRLKADLNDNLSREDFVVARQGWLAALATDAAVNGDNSDALLWVHEAVRPYQV